MTEIIFSTIIPGADFLQVYVSTRSFPAITKVMHQYKTAKFTFHKPYSSISKVFRQRVITLFTWVDSVDRVLKLC